MRIQWVIPREGNEGALGFDVGSEPQRRQVIATAIQQRAPQFTHVLELAQGGRGLVVYAPLFRNGAPDGLLNAAFRAQPLFETMLSDIAPGYGIALYDGSEELYHQTPEWDDPTPEFRHETTLTIPGVTWHVQVWPGPPLLAQRQSSLPEALLFLGCLVAGSLSLAVFMGQRA